MVACSDDPLSTAPGENVPDEMTPAAAVPGSMTTDETTSNESTPETLPSGETTIGEINWSDGDSGRLVEMPFRLRDVDAPETGGVGSAIGGAKCTSEQNHGKLAKEFIVALTENAAIEITNNYGPDRYGRFVVDLNADGIDVATAGIEAGYLKPWPHDADGKSLTAKPNWCEGI